MKSKKMKNNKNKLRCNLSGKIISSNEEVIKTKNAEEYLKKMGYKVISPKVISSLYSLVTIFLIFGFLILTSPSINAERLNDFVFDSSFDTETQDNGLYISENGKYIFIGGFDSDTTKKYNCSVAFDFDSCYNTNQTISNPTGEVQGIQFSEETLSEPAGRYLFFADRAQEKVFQYKCTTPFNLNTCSEIFVLSHNKDIHGLDFDNEGNNFWLVARNQGIIQYDCSSQYNLSTCSYSSSNLLGGYTDYNSLTWFENGTKLFFGGNWRDYLEQANCSDNYNISSCSLSGINKTFESDLRYHSITTKENFLFIKRYDRNLYKYSIPPKIEIILLSPENNSDINGNMVNFTFNLTNESRIQNYSLILNETIVETNNNPIEKPTYNFLKEINESGSYNWSIQSYNIENYMFESETYNFNIDIDKPNLQAELNTSYIEFGSNITLLYSINDTTSNLSRCYYVYAFTEYNFTCGENKQTQIKTQEGFNEVKVYAIDDFGNIASKKLFFNLPRGILYIDFTKDSNVTIFLLITGIALFFFFIGLSHFTALILLIQGFILMFNDINIILSILMISAGVLIAFIIERRQE